MKIDYVDMEPETCWSEESRTGIQFHDGCEGYKQHFYQVDNIALTEMVPSGWEIQNTRLFESNFGIKESTYDYRDFRDDRVNTYFV